ncbi:hypothetical protein SEVIR_6G177900v4 [Setaria viridis]|uniref:Uncharacterized protein n=2 Tax=Setaria TaxID=4554 RepID=K3YMJ4_SETIT|nr:uncharacterized protein LOC101776664 [Setaria italica]XP_034600924.1 uncharacterized protein LOC117861468 [Setaria viridis]RCV31377.1 hypothetical protein SETIT_6G172000v2 [Setaria italica]TKW10624.1 hypothetical protein SEVIR_6G177900v2 [Setaria viridis]
MALNFLRPGAPGVQPVGDRCTAKSAIFIGVVNGLVSPPYLQRCLCAGRCDDDSDVEERYYLLANFVVVVLGVALLVVDMAALSLTVVLSSPRWPAAVRWMVWITKVLTCGTLQLGVNVLYFCIRMLCARLMLAFA